LAAKRNAHVFAGQQHDRVSGTYTQRDLEHFDGRFSVGGYRRAMTDSYRATCPACEAESLHQAQQAVGANPGAAMFSEFICENDECGKKFQLSPIPEETESS
jgi:hypothetical protein